jgi:hypothetical protein
MIFSVLFFVLITAPFLAIHFLWCLHYSTKPRHKHYHYALGVFTGWDQLMNVLLAPANRWLFGNPVFDFGYPDETISSVIGKNILRAPHMTSKTMFIVNKWLTKADPNSDNHGVDSIEEDEGD